MDTDKLLQELDAERNKFTESDKEKIQILVDQLVNAGAYPPISETMAKRGTTHMSMVEGWGAYWHIYKQPHNCPHCNSDLRDRENGPPFKREIGIEVRGLYDGVAYFSCPDCGGKFSRKGTPLQNNCNLTRKDIFTV